MDFSGYTAFPDKELGGLANYDDATMIPMGLATVVRNCRFRKRSVRCRDGYLHTMAYTSNPGQPTTNISQVISQLPQGSTPLLAVATVSSTVGFSVGAQITVAGVSQSAYNGTWTIYAVGVLTISWQLSNVAPTGSGGTITQNATVPPFDFTGVEAIDVLVDNPQQVVIASTSAGALLQETPVGSGSMSLLNPPIPLPPGISMQTAKAYNRIYMAFSDLLNALSPPQVYDGPSGVIAPVSQNPTGAIWTPGRYYIVGDVVRTSQNPSRWFRCTVAGLAGNTEPTWPTLDGYFSPVANPVQTLIQVAWTHGVLFNPSFSTATVNSTLGFSVGDTIVVAGCSNSSFNGTWTISAVGTTTITWLQSGLAIGATGAGGTITDTTAATGLMVNSASATDPNGTSQWVEWTPAVSQFVPTPEAPEVIISVKGQAGAPSGSISSAQDVYVCFAYQNANGESAWTQPIVFLNTAASDVLEVFFQKQNEIPGPTVAPAFGAAGYGGPRMPNWLMSVIGLVDPVIAWPPAACLNVYVNAVSHGSAAPAAYGLFASGAAVDSPFVISSIPSSAPFIPRTQATAALNTIPFTGAGGPRYFAVERQDLNESMVPIDSGSPLLVNLTSSIAPSGTANILFIQRSSDVVTCTVDLLAGFQQGAEVIIEGVTDSSFNGTFQLTGVSPNQFGGATLIWSQTADNGASTSGTATSASAATAFVLPQISIGTISRTTNVVTAVVNSLQGLAVGTTISVSGVTDTSYDGSAFTLTAVSPNLGGGGTIVWDQSGTDGTSSGGTIQITGAAVGTNVPQNISAIYRGHAGGIGVAGQVTCFFWTGQAQVPPGFVVGAQIQVAGCALSDLDGTFTITFAGVITSGGNGPGWGLTWVQSGSAEFTLNSGTVTLLTQGTVVGSSGNISSITRSSGTVTATLDNVSNFSVGARVNVAGVTDSSYDGTFVLTAVNTGSNQLQWSQPGANSTSSGGSVTQTSGGAQQPSPVAVLPPGGQFISQDIAAFTVQGGDQAGPYTFIPEQDPTTPFSAQILSIGAINGAVTALLSSTSGLQPGEVIQISGTPNGWFDGVFVLAEVNGNTVAYSGNGPGTGFAGGTLTLIPTQPTVALGQNVQVPLTAASRISSGLVSAQIADVSNLEPGMRIQVAGTSDISFSGQFTLLSVSQNQLPGSTTPLAGTVTWQTKQLSSGNASGGYITGLPGIIFNADDNELANADDVTAQLSTIGAPSCVDVFFSQSLNMMVYTIGQDSSHYFSNPGDAANIATPGGILGVNESNGERTVCFREMTSGELLSLKEKSGYEITPGSSTPNEWGVSRRWGASGNSDGHGPCSARAVDMTDDFLIYFDMDSGPYRYHQGTSVQVGAELQGTWDRINRAASQQICVAIDNVRKEVHIALPLDGSPYPNHDLVLNYFNGWNEPLMLTLTGELVPDPHGRRWSDNDGTANGGLFRVIKLLKRTLPNPPSQQIAKRQIVFCLSGIQQSTGATGYIDMSVPNQFNDNGQAINQQYQPAYAQSPTLEKFAWDKMKGRVLGQGLFDIQPVTEDPASDVKDVTVDLNATNELPESFQKGMGETVNELFSLLYSNSINGTPQVGAWFELHRSVRYGKVKSSGTPR